MVNQGKGSGVLRCIKYKQCILGQGFIQDQKYNIKDPFVLIPVINNEKKRDK